jgi:O-antigen ligase
VKLSGARPSPKGSIDERVGPSFIDRFGRILDKTVWVCLLALIVVALIPYGTVDAWWEAAFECGVFLLTALWIVEALLRGSWEIKPLSIILPLVGLTAFAFVQTIQLPSWFAIGGRQHGSPFTLSIDPYQTFLTATKLLALTLFFGLLLLHATTPKRLRWLVRVIIGLGLASAVFGILRQLLQTSDSTSGFVLPFLYYGVGYGHFISSNVFAFLMEMAFGMLAGLVLGAGVRRDRILIYVSIIVPVWAALVLSNSRGGILGLTCQSIFLLFLSLTWYSVRRHFRENGMKAGWLKFVGSSPLVRALSIILIVGALVAGVLWMGGESLSLKLAQQAHSPGDAGFNEISRREIWHSTWELIKHNPWSGVGFGAYFLAISEYQKGAGKLKIGYAHNDYLDLTASGGVVAVVLAVWFIALIIRRARASLRSNDAYRRAACLGAIAGLLSVGVHSLVDFGLQVTGIAIVFGALIVVSVADSRVETIKRTVPLSQRS